jgi:hypothetical protein
MTKLGQNKPLGSLGPMTLLFLPDDSDQVCKTQEVFIKVSVKRFP